MIDPHVHLRDQGQRKAETIKHGLSVAKMCGITHVFDMPNTYPEPVTSREVLKARFALADEANVEGIEYHTFFGLTSDRLEVIRAVNIYNDFFPKVVGLKLYMAPTTGNLAVENESDQRMIFEILNERDYKGVVAVHCEDRNYFDPSLYVLGQTETYSLSRPPISELKAIERIINIAKETNFKGILHICHISTKDGIELVKKERKNIYITCGATPHHALLSSEDAKNREKFLKVNPPLRSIQDRDAVFNSLLDGTISWIESDHAPHTIYDKEFNDAAGLPGFAGYLYLIKKLRKASINQSIFDGLIAKNAAKTFGIKITDDDLQVPRSHISISRQAQNEYRYFPYELEEDIETKTGDKK